MFRAILFDLDNTLYTEECGIFDLIDQRMNEWLISRLNVPPEEVNEFRNRYFMKYGTTLRGLMLHHNVNPHEFLEYVHDVPVLECLSADDDLRKTLDLIRSRKIIFTNSDAKHANRILDALGIRDLFEKIFDIEAMHFIPKPNPEAYRLVLEYVRHSPSECLLIDDMERNLRPARALGMHTILIGDGKPADDSHHAIANIKDLNSVLHEIAAQPSLAYNRTMIGQSFLRNIFLFQNLDEKQTGLLMRLLKERSYGVHEKIVEEGRVGESLYMIVAGKVRVIREFDGQAFVLTELGPYDFFGEMSLIDDFPTSATVETLVETTVLKMDRIDFKTLISANSDLSSRLWESLARSLTMKIRKTGDLVKMYYGLNKALCENQQFRQLYTSWNFHAPKS